MSHKADFNAEEWSLLTEAPPLAGMLVITAEKGGTLRESLAIGKTYAEARQQHSGTDLLDELLASNPSVERGQYSSPEELRTGVSEKLRQASALVDEKASPEEASAYKKFILDIAQRAAERHKSGGFAGIGGKSVSDAEAAALAEIAAALDVPYPPPGQPAA